MQIPVRMPTLTCVVVVADEVPAWPLAMLADQAGQLADHAEIVVVANGVRPDTARALALLAESVPDLTIHFLADPVEREVATLIGMDRALGDWVVVLTPTEAEVSALPTVFAATEGCQLVFAAGPGGGGGMHGALGRAFFAISGLLAGVRLEWPTPRLRAYSRAAARWLTGRLDGAVLMRSLSFCGAFPGRRIELAQLKVQPEAQRLRTNVVRAVRQLSRTGTVPLRIAIWFAIGGATAGLLALAYTVATYLTHANLQPGWTTLTGLLSVMMIVFSTLFALLTGCILALYASVQPRARMPVVREVRSNVRRLERSLDVTGGGLGAPADALPDIRPNLMVR